MHRCLLWEILLLEGDCNCGFDHNRRCYHGLAGGWSLSHVVILTGRSPLGDRGRQSMRCAPHLASSTPSVPRRARDGTGGREWLAGLPQDVSTGGCVVRVQSHLPHHGQRQHAPSRFPTPVGDIRKDARNSPFLLAKRYRRVYHLHHIALARYTYLPSWVDIAPLKHATHQGSSPPSSKEPRGGVGRWYSQ